MNKFSGRSLGQLETTHKKLQKLFHVVLQVQDCTILEGYRSAEKQKEMYETGRSHLKAGQSNHNSVPSTAVDVAPYPIIWGNEKHLTSRQKDEAIKRFIYFAGMVIGIAHTMDIKIRYGGDWDMDGDLSDQNFNDLVHFELVV